MKSREEGGLGTPCLDLVKTVFGNVAARVVRAGEMALLETREIQLVSSILVREVAGRFRSWATWPGKEAVVETGEERAEERKLAGALSTREAWVWPLRELQRSKRVAVSLCQSNELEWQ
jgi:hypothetical protein